MRQYFDDFNEVVDEGFIRDTLLADYQFGQSFSIGLVKHQMSDAFIFLSSLVLIRIRRVNLKHPFISNILDLF